MDKKYSFWREVNKKSREKIYKILPLWSDTVRLSITAVVTLILLIAGIWLGVLHILDGLTILWTIVGSEFVLIFILWLVRPFIAWIIYPWIAERYGNDLKASLDQSRTWARQARGELITLSEDNRPEEARIKIHNGETGNPFDCMLYITELSGQPKMNPVALDTDMAAMTHIHVIPDNNYFVTLIGRTSQGDFCVYGGNHDIVFKKSGEYKITTRIEGRFQYLSSPVVKPDKWKLTLNTEKNSLVLEKEV